MPTLMAQTQEPEEPEEPEEQAPRLPSESKVTICAEETGGIRRDSSRHSAHSHHSHHSTGIRPSQCAEKLSAKDTEIFHSSSLADVTEISIEDVVKVLKQRNDQKTMTTFYKRMVVILAVVVILLLGGMFAMSYFAIELTKETHVSSGSLTDSAGATVATHKEIVKVPDMLSIYTMTPSELAGVTRVKFEDKAGTFYVLSVDEIVKLRLTGTITMHTSQGGTIFFGSRMLTTGQREKFILYEKNESTIEVPIGRIDSSGRRLEGTQSPANSALECEGKACPSGTEGRTIPTSDAFALVCNDTEGLCVDSLLSSGNLCAECDLESVSQKWVYNEGARHLSNTVAAAGTTFYLKTPKEITVKEEDAGVVEFGESGELLFQSSDGGRRLEATVPTQKVEVFDVPDERRLGATERKLSCNWWSALMAYTQSDGGKYGNFCGKGIPGRCGGHNNPTPALCPDGGADATCYKHDSGSHSQDVWGIATLNWCEVDREFKAARNSGVINGFHDGKISDSQFLTGANCLFGTMPCLRHQWSSWWGWCRKWWGGYPCRKSDYKIVTLWPFGNYQSGGCRGSCYNIVNGVYRPSGH